MDQLFDLHKFNFQTATQNLAFMNNLFRLGVKMILLSAIIVMIPSCAVNPVTGKKQIMLMSEAQEVQMGASYDPQVVATFGEYKHDRMQSFVQSIANDMGKLSHRPNLTYHVKLLDSPVVNAFAVPGGYIYLTRGILAQLNNEAELIGVIGHEMGHITARHSVSQQSKQQLGQLILIGGMIASEKFRGVAEYAMQGMQLLFLKYSRDDERQADRLGVEYMSKVGYDAHKMADFFQVLNKMNMDSEHGGVPTFLSTHPDPGDRYSAVLQMAGEWHAKMPGTNWKVNQDAYLQMIDGIVYGEDPRQGFVEGNTFYHPDMKFRFNFPAGWQFQNAPTQVTMAPSDGKALMVFTMAAQKSLEEAAAATLQQLELNVTDSRKTTVNGMPAIVAMSTQSSQNQSTGQTQTIKVMSYFIDNNGSYFVFHGVSSDADFNAYTNVFQANMGTFSKLTDPSKLNVQPQKLLVKKVARTGTLSEAFRSLGVPQNKMEEFALLNNLELNSTVQAGKLIKIVGK